LEAYKRQTQRLIKRFLNHRLTFPQCVQALDAALSDLITSSEMKAENLLELRAIMANNETVMKEMEKRGPPDRVQ
jgi:hypothetical protein